MACVRSRCVDVRTLPRSPWIVLLTPDGGFNRGSVVGKRVPGTWSGVLDVFVFCVDDVDLLDTRTRVGPLAGTPSTATKISRCNGMKRHETDVTA